MVGGASQSFLSCCRPHTSSPTADLPSTDAAISLATMRPACFSAFSRMHVSAGIDVAARTSSSHSSMTDIHFTRSASSRPGEANQYSRAKSVRVLNMHVCHSLLIQTNVLLTYWLSGPAAASSAAAVVAASGPSAFFMSEVRGSTVTKRAQAVKQSGTSNLSGSFSTTGRL